MTNRTMPQRSMSLAVGSLLLTCIGACATRQFNAEEGAVKTIKGDPVVESDPLARMAVVLVTEYGSPFCSGSLIGAQTVLTAGHCFIPENAYNFSEFFVYFGTDVSRLKFLPQTLTVQGQTVRRVDPNDARVRKVAHAHLHEEFSQLALTRGNPAVAPQGEKWAWQSLGKDVAIVKLGTPAPADYKPVSLDAAAGQLKAGDVVTTLGFGGGEDKAGNAFKAGRLNQVRSTVEDVRTNFGEFLVNSADGSQSYFGDSGGPVLLKRGSGWIQVGLVSHPAASEQSGLDAAGARVIYTHVSSHAPWILRGAQSQYCTQFRVSSRLKTCEEGDVTCRTGAEGIAFEGSPARFDSRRLTWATFQKGRTLKRFIKGTPMSGFIDTATSPAANTFLPAGNKVVAGFVDTFFVEPVQGGGCVN